MNAFTDENDLVPLLSILIYGTNERVYAEYCKIVNNKETAYMPLSYKAFSDLTDAIDVSKATKSFKGIIPNNVLHYTSSAIDPSIVWYVKGKKRPIIGFGKDKEFRYPNLIFQLKNKQLHVYSILENKITNSSMLYKTPMPNIYDDQHLCFGTMNINNFLYDDYEETMKALEVAFFNSKFTGNMMANKQAVGNVLKIIKDCIKDDKPFPKECMVKYKKLIDVIH